MSATRLGRRDGDKSPWESLGGKIPASIPMPSREANLFQTLGAWGLVEEKPLAATKDCYACAFGCGVFNRVSPKGMLTMSFALQQVDSLYSARYDAIREAWELYASFFNSITSHDIITLLTPLAVACLTFLQWRVNLEASRRYFSDKLLEYLVPILEAEDLAAKMLYAKRNYDNNLKQNQYSRDIHDKPFMRDKKKKIDDAADNFQDALKPAQDSMFRLVLLLGLHRSDTPTADRRYARLVQDKIDELLTFAFQCKAEIIEHGWFEKDGKVQEAIINMQVDDALKKLSKLHREMLNLVTAKYSVRRL